MATINGEPGLLRYLDGQLESAQAFVTDGERIVAIYAVRNPGQAGRHRAQSGIMFERRCHKHAAGPS